VVTGRGVPDPRNRVVDTVTRGLNFDGRGGCEPDPHTYICMDELAAIRTWLSGCDSAAARVAEHLCDALEGVSMDTIVLGDMVSRGSVAKFINDTVAPGISSAKEEISS